MGLADVLVSQLTRRTAILPPEAVSAGTAMQYRDAVPRAADSLSDATSAGRQPDHVVEFRRRMLPHAEAASRASGIPAAFMIGQAALESGWGRNEIRYADGRPSYNLFGIKATGNWNGKVVETMTTEYINGEKLQRVERFRAYDSYAEAFRDFAGLISRNPRYEPVMGNLHHPAGYAHAMQQAGYATDPGYADKLLSVIRRTVAA
jgi:flagellar protein FlgJ